MERPIRSGAYSAKVELELLIGTARYSLAQTGGGRIILSEPAILPGTQGEVVVRVDGQERRWAATWEESAEVRKIVAVRMVTAEGAAR